MICIIGSETTKNYGLLNDLRQLPEFLIIYATPPSWNRTIAWRALRKLVPHFPEHYEKYRRWKRLVFCKLNQLDRIIVIDTALRCLDISLLDLCKRRKPNIHIDCWLLNSTGSMAFSEPRIHSQFYSFHWDTIITFDPGDAEKNGWLYSGICNYSKLSVPVSHKQRFDVFYAGTIMGDRRPILLNILYRMNSNGVNCRYVCPNPNTLHFESGLPKGLELIPRRISYKKILKKTMESNCILEVLQDGQKGSSLRYCEAVCYNKKLLTTNPEIKNYPFYDERYMKVISEDSEIDYEWLRSRETIDYGYRGEFSPIHLFGMTPSKS